MIATTLWLVGYGLIAASIYLYTRKVLVAAAVPLVAQLAMSGAARVVGALGVIA